MRLSKGGWGEKKDGTFSMLVHIECHEYWENKEECEAGHRAVRVCEIIAWIEYCWFSDFFFVMMMMLPVRN